MHIEYYCQRYWKHGCFYAAAARHGCGCSPRLRLLLVPPCFQIQKDTSRWSFPPSSSVPCRGYPLGSNLCSSTKQSIFCRMAEEAQRKAVSLRADL